MQAHAMHDPHAVRRRLDAHAQLGEDRRGGAGVLAFEEAFDAGRTFGQRTEHDRAMRNRFVAGHQQIAAQRTARRCDPVGAHAITSSRLASKRRFSASVPTVMRRHSPRP